MQQCLGVTLYWVDRDLKTVLITCIQLVYIVASMSSRFWCRPRQRQMPGSLLVQTQAETDAWLIPGADPGRDRCLAHSWCRPRQRQMPGSLLVQTQAETDAWLTPGADPGRDRCLAHSWCRPRQRQMPGSLLVQTQAETDVWLTPD